MLPWKADAFFSFGVGRLEKDFGYIKVYHNIFRSNKAQVF